MNSQAKVYAREQEHRDRVFYFMRLWSGTPFSVSVIAMYTRLPERDVRDMLEVGVRLGCIAHVHSYYQGISGQWGGKFFTPDPRTCAGCSVAIATEQWKDTVVCTECFAKLQAGQIL